MTGLAFLALLIGGFALSGEPPNVDDTSAEEIVRHYVDDKDSIIAGALLSGLAAVALVFFAGHLRRVLRDAEGEGGVLSAVALIGATILATAAAIDATILAALAETADDIEPTAAQALQALWDNDFVPFAVGILVFQTATGLSIVRHGALPALLGWVALGLVAAQILAGLTDAEPFWIAFSLGSGLWVLAMSGALIAHARRPAPMAPPSG